MSFEINLPEDAPTTLKKLAEFAPTVGAALKGDEKFGSLVSEKFVIDFSIYGKTAKILIKKKPIYVSEGMIRDRILEFLNQSA